MKKIFKILKPNKAADWSVSAVLEAFDCGQLEEEFNRLVPFQMYQQARRRLAPDEGACLEIKGMADNVSAVKSRGQIGFDSSGEHVLILAKFSIKPPLKEIIKDGSVRRFVLANKELLRNFEGRWIQAQIDETQNGRDEIFTYNLYTLPTYTKIMKSDGQLGLVEQCALRKFNSDFDMKRLPVLARTQTIIAGRLLPQPYTVPFSSLEQMKIHRHQVDNIRRSGRVARPDEVIDRVRLRGKSVRFQGGEAATVVRTILRGVTQGKLLRIGDGAFPDYPEIARLVSTQWKKLPPSLQGSKAQWSTTDVKNAKRANWEEGFIRPHPLLKKLTAELCAVLLIDWSDAESRLFYGDDVQDNRVLVTEVAKLIMNGRCFPRWRELYRAGELPGKDALLLSFPEVITPTILETLSDGEYTPNPRPTSDRVEVESYFRRLGLKNADGRALARIIAPTTRERSAAPKNPAAQSCLENFVTCLLQPEFSKIRPPVWLIKEELSEFGLSEKIYRRIRQTRFIPHQLSHSASNRSQLRKMARLLGLDPAVFIELTIDPPA
ncbi:hypothetical protein HTZ97_07310 [Desulfuromonas acetoxidans]|uniref:Uncharacterized protein n=1 Tax=Desulfuromonas acetoxidans (strain DSM 684 / 11070) TaxID=281689 RepID=Q1K3K7_DESA6|nr:hypothetical protein [Desulfuromonas acetoxidans]EAT16967.1 hypothetical protein Dace_2833 [Desulfuromonas acetoxidans DSM 684]MBF0644502.1 hypothetical protein [Desulfuromonas acetoxidans]NVD23971.1 hypothetical protein [Desulfuromonas acetoxidans]NVE16268.1 hypothetical protein [Desulfuromonas acetoxidans]